MLPLVATVKSGIIKKTATQTAIEAAQNWVEDHIHGPIQTKSGEVIVDKKGIKDSLRHSMYQSKLDAIQALEQVLEQGEYLGMIEDKDGKPIDNHYFAAKVRIGEEDKIVFVRTRKAQGNLNRFYVHEIFTEDEIREKGLELVSNTPPDGQYNGPFDFYKTIITNYLKVKSNSTPPNDPFGQAYPVFTGKPEAAIEHLLQVKNGYVPGAFYKEGLGPIDLSWERLKHIIERRNKQGLNGNEFIRKLPEIIKEGQLEDDPNDKDTKLIRDGKNRAVIALTWNKQKRTWLVSAYPEFKNNQSSDSNTPLNQTYDDGQNPPSNFDDGNNLNALPSFVNDLNDIIAGKYGMDSTKIIEVFEKALDEAEKLPNYEDYVPLLEQASNHLTAILNKKAGK